MTCASAPMLLTGCALFSKPDLPERPEPLQACDLHEPIDVPRGSKSRAQSALLVAEMRKSELRAHRCLRSYEEWYELLKG